MNETLVVHRLRHGHWVALDVAVALLLATAFAAAAQLSTGLPQAVAVAALAALPVATRRGWPLPALSLSLAAAVAALLMGVESAYLPVAFVLYSVGAQEPRGRAVTALAGSLVAVTAALLAAGPSWIQALGGAGFGLALMGLSWTAGLAVREQHLHAARTAERARVEERLRIARDLHDVVAHSMSLITMKAGVAGLVAESRPQEAREALHLIETTGRQAMREMRAMLGMLRSESGAPGTAPAPRPADLHALAAHAGVEVDLRVEAEDLPEGVGLAVYRIVQEALTNVVKHARTGCRVRVTVPEPGMVEVEVTDDGRGTPRDGGGFGLVGMRERCLMYGGRFTAGPRPEGGFRVLARLPYTLKETP
ncbi:sensor histidine kinase [Nonomuraea fuscirosea]|uniref:sensor histidine kinase n=1 Tax=Nonomuraea fuscirosea TaxID=1291556 RepID=UPI002DDC4344|nr:sensor histidine kinase [Nonomuraea fuscirosea]WSA56814.1 sensor histidine kinase [Nonomuraea fuscirosea]